jgi:hypothetical protein
MVSSAADYLWSGFRAAVADVRNGLWLLLSSVIIASPALALRVPMLHALGHKTQRNLLQASQCSASLSNADQLSSLVRNVPPGNSELLCLQSEANLCDLCSSCCPQIKGDNEFAC